MVVELSEGVVKLVPLARAVPPVGLANQFSVPVEDAAEIVIVPFPQLDASEKDVMEGSSCTDTFTVSVLLHPVAVMVWLRI